MLQLENVLVPVIIVQLDAGLLSSETCLGRLLLDGERRPRTGLGDAYPGQACLPLRLSLVRALILVVDTAEIGHDDWHGQGDHQHAAQRTNTANDFARNRLRHHVAVAGINRLDSDHTLVGVEIIRRLTRASSL